VDVERRHGEGDAVALAFSRREMPRIEKVVHPDFEDSGDLAVRRRQRRPRRVHGDDRMQAETADRNIQRRERAQDAHLVQRQRDLLVRLAERRLLERLPRIDNAARQRDLAAMPQRISADGEDDVGLSRR